ncbi:MAG: DUF839 domain-containing protein [Myxococcales bacterium]|nr:DUF839 domain-containing protein [Myxococcales bacterium]
MAVPKLSRRVWIGAGSAAALSVPLGMWILHEPRVPDGPLGPLRRDPNRVFDLAPGFEYQIVDRVRRRMTDGYLVPPRPDGMACFEGEDGAIVLMRNHELPVGFRDRAIGRRWPRVAYDPEGAGAVTRVVLDAATLEVRSSNLVLCGTSMNCSGGPSPWGWLSCEEDPGDPTHGFVFLCDPAATEAAPPNRIDGYGRFKHEAAAVLDGSHVCYLTEDQVDGCLYRFVPHDPAAPFEGRLQAMRIRGGDADTAPLRTGERRDIDWIDLANPTPLEDDLRETARRAGAARVKRGEGVCIAEGRVHVVATTGGPIDAGQIFRIEDGADRGTLEVLAASEDRGRMDMPDNVTAAPDGTIFFVEDGSGQDLLRYVTADGRVLPLGRNAGSDGEIAGVCFSPDAQTLFVNLQEEGLTLAIRGPFATLRG